MTETQLNETWQACRNRTRVQIAGPLVTALYRKIRAEANASLAEEPIDWTTYNLKSDIAFELAGIIGVLGFDLEGNRK